MMSNSNLINIVKVETDEQLNIIRNLFIEYSNELSFELDFQDFNNELKNLSIKYAGPDGCLLLAYYNKEITGCIGLSKFEQDICEMKRLYVKNKFRNRGIGKKLSVAVISEAKKIGYKRMRLDTISNMKDAINIYKQLGFYEILPYRYNPYDNAVFMELIL